LEKHISPTFGGSIEKQFQSFTAGNYLNWRMKLLDFGDQFGDRVPVWVPVSNNY